MLCPMRAQKIQQVISQHKPLTPADIDTGKRIKNRFLLVCITALKLLVLRDKIDSP